jgi:hypothetical protein
MSATRAVLREEFERLSSARALDRPDGRPLYAYRFDDQEYERMRVSLTDHGGYCLASGHGAALFVAYTAEWFRRGREGGHWDWIRPLQTLGIRYHHTGRASDVNYGQVRNAVEMGLRYWARPKVKEGRYLFSVVRESGFPAAAVRENHAIATWLKRSILTAERGFTAGDAVMMEGWRVGDTIAQTLCDAAGDLCAAIIALRAEIGAIGSNEDSVDRLDRLRPSWRDGLPFAVEERDIRVLVEQMVRVRAKAADGLSVTRRVVKVDGGWRAVASIELRGELELSKFANSVRQTLNSAGRARIVPRPPLGGDLRPIASIERWSDDHEEGRWEVRPLVAKFEKGLALDDEFRLAMATNDRLFGEFVPPSGEACLDSVVLLEPADGAQPDASTTFEVLGGSPTNTPRPWLALAVRIDALAALTIDGERYDLGPLGETRVVIAFRGEASMLADGVSLKWRTGCTLPVLRRLHFVGEMLRSVVGHVHVGLPAVWLEDGGHFSQRRPETMQWRPHGRGRWREFREGNPFGTIDVAVIADAEVVAVAALVVVPSDFTLSGDASRRILAVRGLAGARVGSSFPMVRTASDVTIDLARLPPGGTVRIELNWDASLSLTMPNPTTETAMLDPAGREVDPRTWLCLDRLAGYRILSARAQTLHFELHVGGGARTQLTREVLGNTPLTAFTDEMEKLLGGSQSLDAEVWISWPGCADRAAQVRRWGGDVDPFVAPPSGALAEMLRVISQPKLAALSLSTPEAGVIRHVAPAPQGAMATALRAALGIGPWLIFGTDCDDRPLRPRSLSDRSAVAAVENLIQSTAIESVDVREQVQNGLLGGSAPLGDSDRNFVIRLAALAASERLPLSSIDVLKAVARAPRTAVGLLARCATFEQRHDLIALQRHLPFLWCATPVRTWIDGFAERHEVLAQRLADAGLGRADATARIATALDEILDARPELAAHVRATILMLVAGSGPLIAPSAASLLRRLSWTLVESVGDKVRSATAALITRHADHGRPPTALGLADRAGHAREHWSGYEAHWADVIAAPFVVAATAAGVLDMDLETSRACRAAWLFDADHFEEMVPILVQAHAAGSINNGRVAA